MKKHSPLETGKQNQMNDFRKKSISRRIDLLIFNSRPGLFLTSSLFPFLLWTTTTTTTKEKIQKVNKSAQTWSIP